MSTIVELEAQDGTTVYVNPDCVVAVETVPGAVVPLSVVTVVGASTRTVKGDARDVAAHIFSVRNEHGQRVVGFARPGHALRKERVPLMSADAMQKVLG